MSLSRLPAAVKELLNMHLTTNAVTRWQITGDGHQSVVSIHCTEAQRSGRGAEGSNTRSKGVQAQEKKCPWMLSSYHTPFVKAPQKLGICKAEMGQTCILVCVLVIAVVSLGLNLTGLLTDHWFSAVTSDNVDPKVKQAYSFHYGLWRLCYEEGLPDYIAGDSSYKKDGSCVYIYEQLIQKNEEDLDSNSRLRLHLSRTVLGCSVACGVAILASLLSLLCGLCRLCSSYSVKRPCVYLSASLLLLLATMCGIASGICFIALRDLDNTTTRSSPSSTSVLPLPPALPEYVGQEYSWSFMLHWIATGLALVDSFLVLCLLHNSYEFVGEDSKSWSRYNSI